MSFASAKKEPENIEEPPPGRAEAAFGRWVIDKAVHDDALAIMPKLAARGSTEESWREVLLAYANTYGALGVRFCRWRYFLLRAPLTPARTPPPQCTCPSSTPPLTCP